MNTESLNDNLNQESLYSAGSINPTICFCLTLKNPNKELFDFIREYQISAPIFKDENKECHRLTCETIIRTENTELFKGLVTGIDDCYVFENLRTPFNNRSVFEIHYSDEDSFQGLFNNDMINGTIKQMTIDEIDNRKVGPFLICLNKIKLNNPLTNMDAVQTDIIINKKVENKEVFILGVH